MAEIVHENKIRIVLKVRDKQSLTEQSYKIKKTHYQAKTLMIYVFLWKYLIHFFLKFNAYSVFGL